MTAKKIKKTVYLFPEQEEYLEFYRETTRFPETNIFVRSVMRCAKEDGFDDWKAKKEDSLEAAI